MTKTPDLTKHTPGPHRNGKFWEPKCTAPECRMSGGLMKTIEQADEWCRDHLRQMRRTDGRTILNKTEHMIGWSRIVGGKVMVYQLHYPIAGTPATMHIYAWDHSLRRDNKRIR